MTAEECNETMLVMTAQAIFRNYARHDWRADDDKMRAFALAILDEVEIADPAEVYDRVVSQDPAELLIGCLDHPDVVDLHRRNPLWKKMGIPPELLVTEH